MCPLYIVCVCSVCVHYYCVCGPSTTVSLFATQLCLVALHYSTLFGVICGHMFLVCVCVESWLNGQLLGHRWSMGHIYHNMAGKFGDQNIWRFADKRCLAEIDLVIMVKERHSTNHAHAFWQVLFWQYQIKPPMYMYLPNINFRPIFPL